MRTHPTLSGCGMLLALLLEPVLGASEASPLHWPEPPEQPHPSGLAQASPESYPDADGLRSRAERIVRQLAQEDLGKWRRGYFAGGDPGKYLPTAAMARLIVDPEDESARRYMNDERSAKEHYHFACLNWARYLPLFGDTLTEDTWQRFAEHGWKHTAYYNGQGTENHKAMWYTSALVIPEYLEVGKGIGRKSSAAVLADRKAWLKQYVKGLYDAGMGEWDSATYHMFTTHGFLNIYDFSTDPETRAWAAAALDYFVGAYALKYRDGTLAGPSQRGFAGQALKKITDQSGWVWWDSSYEPSPLKAGNFRYAMHAATSGWRPNRVLCRLAQKQLPDLPADYRNSKSNYWLGQGLTPKANVLQESLHVSADFTLGSLWSGWDRHGQTVRWQLTCDSDAGGIGLTGGHPWGGRQRDGLGRYEQTAQAESCLVLLYRQPSQAQLAVTANKAFDRALAKGEVTRHLEKNPEHGDHPEEVLTTTTVTDADRQTWVTKRVDQELAQLHGRVQIPILAGMRTPVQIGDWWVSRLGHCYIGLRPIGGEAGLGSSILSARARKRADKRGEPAIPEPVWLVEGTAVGFVLQVAGHQDHASLGAFAKALQNLSVEEPAELGVTLTTLTGRRLAVTYSAADKAVASIDDTPVRYDDWPVFGGPHLQLSEGVLRAWDGELGYEVDVRGDLPSWKPWQP